MGGNPLIVVHCDAMQWIGAFYSIGQLVYLVFIVYPVYLVFLVYLVFFVYLDYLVYLIIIRDSGLRVNANDRK